MVIPVQLDETNIEAYALGCALLSAGGGGDPAIGLVMARRAIAASGPIPVIDCAEVDPDLLVLPCGLIGSPTVAQERVWHGAEIVQLAGAAERLAHAPVGAVMCYEIAGVNGLLPVIWAITLGRPLLDADGMGRAFPEMQQQAMHVAGVPASPVILTDGRGNIIVVEAADNLEAERLTRSCAATFDGVCAGALYVMTARSASAAAIRGSVSKAIRIGTVVSSCDSGWLAALADETAGQVLIAGKITEIDRRTDASFTRGHAVVEGCGLHAGRRLRLELQNEVLVAIEDGEVRATVPDIIALLELENGRPVETERLHYGQRIGVVAIPGPDVWRSDEGLQVVGPRAFGYDVDYVEDRKSVV